MEKSISNRAKSKEGQRRRKRGGGEIEKRPHKLLGDFIEWF